MGFRRYPIAPWSSEQKAIGKELYGRWGIAISLYFYQGKSQNVAYTLSDVVLKQCNRLEQFPNNWAQLLPRIAVLNGGGTALSYSIRSPSQQRSISGWSWYGNGKSGVTCVTRSKAIRSRSQPQPVIIYCTRLSADLLQELPRS